MFNKKNPVREYITNLVLMNITMGEMIRQLEELVIEDDVNDKNKHSDV